MWTFTLINLGKNHSKSFISHMKFHFDKCEEQRDKIDLTNVGRFETTFKLIF